MYLTVISVFIFLVVMSAVVGYLFHATISTLISSKPTSPLIGAISSVLIVCFLIMLVQFGIWYVYSIAIILTLGLYFVLVKSMNKNHKA